jgi:MFS transporter, DHA2 family, multidrug resistance protein
VRRVSPAETGAMTPFRRLLIILPVLMSTTLFVLNQTNVVVALPHMQGAFSATRDQIAWVLTSYIVTTTIVTASTGWFAARFGRKTIFLLSVGFFGLSSVLCANATSLETEVAFRMLQGIAGGPLMPVTQAIMLDIYPRERHGTALGIWGIGITIGPVLGPIVGGFITEDYGWPWVFYFNVPFSALAFLGVLLFVPSSRADKERKLDWFGFAALSVAITAIQLILNRGELEDWYASTEIIVETAVAGIALYMLAVHTLTARHSFLVPEMFKDRNLVFGLIFIFCWAIAAQAPLVMLSLRLQAVDGFPVYMVGLLMAPRGFGGILSMSLAGRALRLFNPKLVSAFGFICIATGSWLMQSWPANVDMWEVGVAGFIMGMGTAQAYVALTTMALASTPVRLRPDAVSLYSVVLNMGSGIGIAICVIVLSQAIQANHEILASHVTLFGDSFREHLLPHAWNLESKKGLTAIDREVVNQATALAFNRTFQVTMFLALLMIPCLNLLTRPKQTAKS